MTETDSSSEIDIRAIVGLLRRQWKIIAYVTVLCLGIALLWLLAVTPLYTARALVQINTQQSNLLEDANFRASSAAADNARMASEVEILRSPALALAVVQNADLVSSPEFGVSIGLRDRLNAMFGFAESSQPDTQTLLRGVVNRFQNSLNVRRSGLTYLIEISMTSRSPETAARLANMTANTYIDTQVAAKVSGALAARDVVAARLEQADAELTASEQAFEDFIDLNIDRIAAEGGSENIAQLRADFERIRAEGTQAEISAEQARRALEQQNWQVVASELEDAVLVELADQRAQLSRTLADASEERAIDLRAALTRVENELQTRSTDALAAKLAEAESLATQISGYQDDIRSAVLTADLPSDLLTQVFSIQQQATLARTQYQTLLSRVRDFETQAELQVADARVVSPALAPIGPSFPDRTLLLSLALLGGIGLGTAFAFLREFYVGGFTSDKQVTDFLGIKVPASVPRLNDESASPADVLVDQQLSLFAESFRRLRASIDQAVARRPRPNDGATIIVVASTVPSEGKTTTSLGLARTYALSGQHTLLIDCDLRKPSISNVVGLETGNYGLLDYLTATDADTNTLERIMSFDKKTDLEIIASLGRSNRPTDQLLTSARFTRLLEQARAHYDVIVIDTPPVLPVVDARYIAQHADAIAMVIKWSDTRQQDVRQTLSILEESKAADTPIFALLNQQAGRRGKNFYQGYYGYGQTY